MTEDLAEKVASSGSESRIRLTGPETRDGEKYFSHEDLIAYELAQYKVVAARQSARLKQYEAEEYQKKANATLSQLQLQVKQLQSLAEQKQNSLREFQSAVAKEYNVDLSMVSYDDETGRIQEPPTDDEGPPIKA